MPHKTIEERRAYFRERARRAKEQGLCSHCHKASVTEGLSTCTPCRERRKPKLAAYRKNNREKIRKAVKAWQERNTERVRAYCRAFYQKRKADVYKLLGDRCKRCGFTDPRALQIDHINGGGLKQFRELKNYVLYLKLVLETPENYQLLCANCNWIKRHENGER